MFENSGIILFYILSSFVQLIHYEYYGVKSYTDLHINEYITVLDVSNFHKKEITCKLKFILESIIEIIKMKRYSIDTELEKIISMAKKNCLTALPKNEIRLNNLYNPLDLITEYNNELVLSKITVEFETCEVTKNQFLNNIEELSEFINAYYKNLINAIEKANEEGKFS